MLDERLKITMEEAENERAFREVSEANLRDKGAMLEAAEKRFAEAEKARAMAEKRAADFEGKLGEAKIRLIQSKNVIPARDKEVTDLKEAWQRAKTNSMTWDLSTLRILMSQSSLNLSGMGSGKDGS